MTKTNQPIDVHDCCYACAHLQLMGDEENGLVAGGPADGAVEKAGAHVGVERAQRVVEEDDWPLAVERAGQAHPLTLATTQVGTAFANLQQGNVRNFRNVAWSNFCKMPPIKDSHIKSTLNELHGQE